MYRLLRSLLVPLANRKIASVDGREHVPNDRPFILASNHTGWLDPLFLTAIFWRIVRRQLLFIAATDNHAWTGSIIPIDPRDRARCLDTALEQLRAGRLVGVFPFGTDDARRDRPMTGAARLARRSNFPVLPVFLQDASMGYTWGAIRNFFRSPRRARVRIGSPLYFSGDTFSAEDLQRDMQRIAEAIDRLHTA